MPCSMKLMKNYNNFLVNVVPVNIHELSSYYSEEKSQYLRNEIDHFEVSNEEVSSVLEYLKLPKALVSIKESLREQALREAREILMNFCHNLSLIKLTKYCHNIQMTFKGKILLKIREKKYIN